MSVVKITGLVLILAGVLGVVYGGFSYTENKQEAVIGPLELTVKDTHNVNIPVWAGAGVIVLGAVLLLFPGRKV